MKLMVVCIKNARDGIKHILLKIPIELESGLHYLWYLVSHTLFANGIN